MSTKKVIIGIIIAIVLIAVIVALVFYMQTNNQKKAEQALNNFVSLINEKNYDAMYENTASMNMSKEDFVTRNKNIYEGIDAENITISISDIGKTTDGYKISYRQQMNTSAGDVEFYNSADIVKENKEYKLKWTSRIIFPQLEDTDKVRVEKVTAKRGTIFDRNDVPLAKDGQIASVGIVPGKLGENKEESVNKISELTGVSVEYINEELNKSYVNDDTFVPVKKISDSNTELKDQLLQIPGVLINKEAGREYSLGEEAGHLVGYVQTINADELEQNAGKGYTTTSLIGKSGLESSYEDTLRGIDGTRIYITDSEGNEKVEIAKQDKKDGQDIKLTIDSNLQQAVYNQMKNDKGLFVIMEPQTGELLALVSTPTFNSNDFVVGITTEKWNELNNNEARPLLNKFTQKYCPGSTFKPVTGAVGLTLGKVDPNEDLGYSGTSWQKDSSWGNYHVTTLTGYNEPKNLANAIMYSDNIYFAQTALKIGAKDYASGLDKLGFNEQIEFPLSLAKSQYARDNGTQIEGETKLADTGYGQGDVLVNPIHMASIYSAFANDGNMIKPHIEYDESKNGEYLKENAITQEAANIIKDDLIQVVESGTATDMKMDGITIAGKTGTAELKTSSEDTQSGTLGWFNCFTKDRAQGNMLIVSMVENVQDNTEGGSHYLIQKIRNILSM